MSTSHNDFGYTYNPVGTIATWSQQSDTNATATNTLSYDNADQLTSSTNVLSGTDTSNTYAYDPAGNRLAETALSGGTNTTTSGQFNNVNQLTAYGSTTLSSTTDQTVSGYTTAAVSGVTVNAVAASIISGTNFTASVPLPNGTNIVSVVAQPTSTNIPITTQRVQIVTSASGSAATALTYDANGNVTTDEHGNAYQWDALNRLAKITYYSSGYTTTFAYDGLSRRVQIVENNGSGTVTKNYVWIGSEIAEERNSSNTVTKRFFPQGEQQIVSDIATPYYYARYYSPVLGRFISRDPLSGAEFSQGTNLYAYCGNNFLNRLDPTGMCFASMWNDLTMGAGVASALFLGTFEEAGGLINIGLGSALSLAGGIGQALSPEGADGFSDQAIGSLSSMGLIGSEWEATLTVMAGTGDILSAAGTATTNIGNQELNMANTLAGQANNFASQMSSPFQSTSTSSTLSGGMSSSITSTGNSTISNGSSTTSSNSSYGYGQIQ